MEDKNPSLKLWLGIIFLPIIFSWFTLKKGYKAWVRVAAFAWLIVLMVVSLNTDTDTDNSFVEAPTQVEEKLDEEPDIYNEAQALPISFENINTLTGAYICDDEDGQGLESYLWINTLSSNTFRRIQVISGKYSPQDPNEVISLKENGWSFKYNEHRFLPDQAKATFPIFISYYEYDEALQEYVGFEQAILSNIPKKSEYIEQVRSFRKAIQNISPSVRDMFLTMTRSQLISLRDTYKGQYEPRRREISDSITQGFVTLLGSGLDENPELKNTLDSHFMKTTAQQMFDSGQALNLKISRLDGEGVTLVERYQTKDIDNTLTVLSTQKDCERFIDSESG